MNTQTMFVLDTEEVKGNWETMVFMNIYQFSAIYSQHMQLCQAWRKISVANLDLELSGGGGVVCVFYQK